MQPTAREEDVLTGLIQGLSNKEIALSLGISDHTVREHVSRLLRKFTAANRTELVARYLHSRSTPEVIHRGVEPETHPA
jgi:DNA-binding NarL/FixJ family response regulator